VVWLFFLLDSVYSKIRDLTSMAGPKSNTGVVQLDGVEGKQGRHTYMAALLLFAANCTSSCNYGYLANGAQLCDSYNVFFLAGFWAIGFVARGLLFWYSWHQPLFIEPSGPSEAFAADSLDR